MAHELARRPNGAGAMFSVGETPWHGEGTVLDRPPRSAREALQLAGLDFDVELRPILMERSGRGAGGYDRLHGIPHHAASCRADTGQVLGIVGNRYRPLQNRDAFRILQPLLDSGKAALETAGALRDGRDVWILVRFAVDDPIVEEVFADEVTPFGLLSNNHAGERGVVLQETPIRVVCANTLGAAHGTADRERAFRVRHTLNVGLRTTDAARELWGALIERYRVIADQYRALRRSFLTEPAFESLVLDVLAPIRPRWLSPNATRGQQAARERAEARRARLSHLWTGGRGHTGDTSAWEAYNAAVEALDHDAALWPSKGERTASLYNGHLQAAKQRVLDGLLGHCR
jgi:phage/plasmid-like protein (TIGR03299 family)